MTLFLIFSFFLLFFIFFFYIGHKGFYEKILPLPSYPPNEIMPYAESFFLEGTSDCCFLLIHGFTGTPYHVRSLGEYFNKKGHSTLGILLPGHGTKVEDLIPIRFYHYLAVTDQFLLNLSNFYKNIFIIGFSMGGTIALELAFRRKSLIKGIALISTPVFFNGFYLGKLVFHSPLMMFSGWLKYLINVIHLKRGQEEKEEPGKVGYLFQYPIGAFHSFKVALKNIRKKLKFIRQPIALVINENDKTVPKESMFYVLYNVNSIVKKAFFFQLPIDNKTGHMILNDPRVQPEIFHFLDHFFSEILLSS
ncbi:MAG: alpha/beta hydrolase [Leptonema sp. (in: bacteria)]